MARFIAFSFLLIIQIGQSLFAQQAPPENWFNLDPKLDKIPGVSTERAYAELLKNKKGKQIIVAVIDGGTDPMHEDLKEVIWTNIKELPNNNIDDDGNGYIDDIHGWNFIGGQNGEVKEDNLELTRMYVSLSLRYKNVQDDGGTDYAQFKKVKSEYDKRVNEATHNVSSYKGLLSGVDEIRLKLGTDKPTPEALKAYKPTGKYDQAAQQLLLRFQKMNLGITDLKSQLQPAIDHYEDQLKYHLNTDLDTRKIVGDNYENVQERIYGNNKVKGPEANHGTHVAGIVAAVRNNGKGMNGVADNVRIMVLRVVPNGDERDKDVANAIRYAVDNGAQIINMSFGKSYSPQKEAVDAAVRYAAEKNVLLVHAAGNDGKNTDIENNFPNRVYTSTSTEAPNWIEVGASSWKKGKYIVGDFSNYAMLNVDVFAPGVDIYSTLPDNTYGSYDGTSMAAPVTAGVAALVWSYYPQLTAIELKEIMLLSAIKIKGKVIVPGEKKKKVKMKKLCKTGGIVNAYEALKMAEVKMKK